MGPLGPARHLSRASHHAVHRRASRRPGCSFSVRRLTLSRSQAPASQSIEAFSMVISLVTVGSTIVTINAKLLGGKGFVPLPPPPFAHLASRLTLPFLSRSTAPSSRASASSATVSPRSYSPRSSPSSSTQSTSGHPSRSSLSAGPSGVRLCTNARPSGLSTDLSAG